MSDGVLETEPRYLGLFGQLCSAIPAFDVRAPGEWRVSHREYDRTAWHHPSAGIQLVVVKEDIGWNVYICEDVVVEEIDEGCELNIRPEDQGVQLLPRGALRWNAFGAARQFLDGGPLLLANGSGVLTIDDFLGD